MATVAETATYQDLVNRPTNEGNSLGALRRIAPGDVDNSAVDPVMAERDATASAPEESDAGAEDDAGADRVVFRADATCGNGDPGSHRARDDPPVDRAAGAVTQLL